jgi:hypothetical protein
VRHVFSALITTTGEGSDPIRDWISGISAGLGLR